MDREKCYQLLGLGTNASLEEIKASYRRLALRYHPDVNPDNQEAHTRFVELNQAYNFLSGDGKEGKNPLRDLRKNEIPARQSIFSSIVQNLGGIFLRRKSLRGVENSPPTQKHKLKSRVYFDLQQLFREGHLIEAIALIENLAQSMPQDTEVRQWQAITYQQWGKQLIRHGNKEQGLLYLQKAILTDPYNRSLWQSVQDDLRA